MKEIGQLFFFKNEWLELLDTVYKMEDYLNDISRSQYNLKIEINQS